MTGEARHDLELACPACAGEMAEKPDRYRCRDCAREYPIMFGIPDFRLKGDQYLSLDEERAKARRLHEFAQGHDFVELVDFYYSITDDVPEKLARKFVAYVHEAPDRLKPVIGVFGPISASDRLLDLGCGSGGALVASSSFGSRVGIDIALRWLVICKKRLEELGAEAMMFCADAGNLPFKSGQFTHVIANDLVEHARDPRVVVHSAAAQLSEGGKIHVSANNARWPGPHPAVGIWAAGLMPASMRTNVARRLRGVDVLRHTRFVTAGQIRRWLQSMGLFVERVGPQTIDVSRMRRRGFAAGMLAGAYRAGSAVPGVRHLLVALGPAFELVARKPDKGES